MTSYCCDSLARYQHQHQDSHGIKSVAIASARPFARHVKIHKSSSRSCVHDGKKIFSPKLPHGYFFSAHRGRRCEHKKICVRTFVDHPEDFLYVHARPINCDAEKKCSHADLSGFSSVPSHCITTNVNLVFYGTPEGPALFFYSSRLEDWFSSR